MNKKIIKKMTAFVLACVLILQSFTACNNSDGNVIGDTSPVDENGEQTPVISADDVDFNSSGEYTASIISEIVDLSDVTAEGLTVSYDEFDGDGYVEALEKAGYSYIQDDEEKEIELTDDEASDDSHTANIADINIEDYITKKQVKVTGVEAQKNKITLSFTDPDAAANMTGRYKIVLNGKKYDDGNGGQCDISAELSVNFKQYTATANIDSVVSNADETRLTLELDDGSFKDNVTKDDIVLSGSFEDMTIESVSSSGKNLTMQLTGNPIKPEGLTTYVDGTVTVQSEAMNDTVMPVRVDIPIQLAGNSLDPSTIKADGEKVTAALELVGSAIKPEDITADDISFDTQDIKVTDVKADGEALVTLTMAVKGAKDGNTAAAALNDRTLKIGGEEILVTAGEAYFYPVFDYAEDNGDSIDITVIVYSKNGTVSDDISPEQITLGEDFKDGKVNGVTKDSDTTATVELSVPANGQSVEDMNLEGEIVLKAGALVSSWGDPTSTDSSYVRKYSQESLGKGVFDWGNNIDFAESEMEFFIRQYDGNIIQRFRDFYLDQGKSFAENALQNMPWPPSADDILELKSFLDAQYNIINDAKDTLIGAGKLALSIYTFLGDMGIIGENKEMLAAFEKTKERTEKLKDAMTQEYQRLENLHANILADVVTRLDERMAQLNIRVRNFKEYFNYINDLGVVMPDESEGADAMITYGIELSKALDEASKFKEPGFESYSFDYDKLQEQFNYVCNTIIQKSYGDPITALDTAYSKIDNFSTTSYYEKYFYRVNLQEQLREAIECIRLYKMAQAKLKTDADGSFIKQKNGDSIDCYVMTETYDQTEEQLYAKAVARIWEDFHVYNFKKIDLSGWKNPVFSREKSYESIPCEVRYSSATVKEYNKNSSGTEIPQTYARPLIDTVTGAYEPLAYCYTLGETIGDVSNFYTCENIIVCDTPMSEQISAIMRLHASYIENQIKSFFDRLQGRTLAQDLLKAHISIDSDTANQATERGSFPFGIAFDTFIKKEDWHWFQYSYNTRSRYFYWDAKDVNDRFNASLKVCSEDYYPWAVNPIGVFVCGRDRFGE